MPAAVRILCFGCSIPQRAASVEVARTIRMWGADMEQLDAEWYATTFEQVKNWGRWGPDDERGTLNLLTRERTAAAMAQVRSGRAIGCAFDLEKHPGPDNPYPAHHYMIGAGDAGRHSRVPGFEQSTDYFGVACHGLNVTHLDALCHIFV